MIIGFLCPFWYKLANNVYVSLQVFGDIAGQLADDFERIALSSFL